LLRLVHQGLFRAGLLITLIVAGWGLLTYLRKQPITGGYRSTLVMTELVFVLQALVGIALVLTGTRLRDGLHVLYGVVLVLALPIAASYTAGRERRREPLVFGLVGVFMLGLTIRALMTS